jgi:FeS assembly SUF system protein
MVKIAIASAPEAAAPPTTSPLREKIIYALRTVIDPELPVNIYDLGLIYTLEITSAGQVQIAMTLTAPNCPVAGELPGQVQAAVAAVNGVAACTVQLVWQPAWHAGLMSEAARLECGLL